PMGQKVGDNLGMEYMGAGIKTGDRTLVKEELEKMLQGRDAAGIKDIVRGTLVANTPDQADAAVNEMAKHMPIVDEGWKRTDMGYVDRAVNVRFPNGQIGEMLIAPPEMVDAKSSAGGGGHGMYKEWRNLPEESPRALELRD